MPSSPLQFVNAYTYPQPPIAEPLCRGHKLRRPICAPVSQQRPGDARHFVGKRHCHDLEGPSRQQLREPRILIWVLHSSLQHRMSADDEDASQIGIALLANRPELLLAPRRVSVETSRLAFQKRANPRIRANTIVVGD